VSTLILLALAVTTTMIKQRFYVDCVVEITAANVSNVCTFAVMGDTDIDQTVII